MMSLFDDYNASLYELVITTLPCMNILLLMLGDTDISYVIYMSWQNVFTI